MSLKRQSYKRHRLGTKLVRAAKSEERYRDIHVFIGGTGAVEAFRMVSEGLEKTTGTEHLDGIWGYERRPTPERWDDIPGTSSYLRR